MIFKGHFQFKWSYDGSVILCQPSFFTFWAAMECTRGQVLPCMSTEGQWKGYLEEQCNSFMWVTTLKRCDYTHCESLPKWRSQALWQTVYMLLLSNAVGEGAMSKVLWGGSCCPQHCLDCWPLHVYLPSFSLHELTVWGSHFETSNSFIS